MSVNNVKKHCKKICTIFKMKELYSCIVSITNIKEHTHTKHTFIWLLISCSRHVKGRVLVALADGTLAIFHRGVGKSVG